MNCQNCNKETSNPKYCSKKCAAIINNKLYPKRIICKHNKCQICSKVLHNRGSKLDKMCHRCYNDKKCIEYGEKSLKEVIIEGNNRASKHKYELVRSHAKRIVKLYNIEKKCKCGYDKHFELCHIKSISSFDLTCKIKEINSKENLVYLCPNCHWELDNLK